MRIDEPNDANGSGGSIPTWAPIADDLVPLPTWALSSDGLPTWAAVNEQLEALSTAQRRADHAQGRLLLAAKRLRVPAELGMGSLIEYAERLFGYSPRALHERLRVALALEGLPKLDAAFADGELNWCVVRELTRVVDADTEQTWVEDAIGKTVRQVETMVAGRVTGQLPEDPSHLVVELHAIRLEVSADVLAVYRDGIAWARSASGEELDEAEALALLLRRALAPAESATEATQGDAAAGAVADPGASYQVAITVCARCQQGFAETGGELQPVDDDVTERAACDAERIGCVDGSTHMGHPAHVGQVEQDAGDTLIPTKPERASRSVPPAVKRAVLRRQRRRCAAPGCRAGLHDMHHLHYPVGRTLRD